MSRITSADVGQNVCAYLDALAHSEGTAGHGDDGYNVIVGGSLFDSYATHPNKSVYLPRFSIHSTAAGRYQIIYRTWGALQAQLQLLDFSPLSQDRACIELIRQRGALQLVQAGQFESAIYRCAREWASLPGSTAGQHLQAMDDLIDWYQQAGGKLA